MVDRDVVSDAVAAAELKKSDTVVEIGAGTGVLTKELARRAGKVIAFEIDRDLIPVLAKELAGLKNIRVVNQDFLKVSRDQPPAAKYKLIGSIPYQITSPLIHKLLTLDPKPSLVVLLIQKEVAEKIAAQPPKATYLSNIVKLLGDAEIVRFVPKIAFWPVPEVDGAILKIEVKREKLKVDIDDFQKFLHRGFQNARKMMNKKFSPAVLQKAGIDPAKRAQHLEFSEWLNLLCLTK